MNNSVQQDTPEKLVIAISSRALFDLDESHRVFESEGLGAYARYQIEHEDEPLLPGEAFPLVKKLLRINEKLGSDRVEVILLSRNSADLGSLCLFLLSTIAILLA